MSGIWPRSAISTRAVTDEDPVKYLERLAVHDERYVKTGIVDSSYISECRE
jgi:hypothetical protein